MTDGNSIVIAELLALDSAGTDGPTSDTGRVVSLANANAAMLSIVLLALTATSVEAQMQVSIDGTNWVTKGSSQSMTGIGRKVLTIETGLAAPYARFKFTITGTGKAILSARLCLSQQ